MKVSLNAGCFASMTEIITGTFDRPFSGFFLQVILEDNSVNFRQQKTILYSDNIKTILYKGDFYILMPE